MVIKKDLVKYRLKDLNPEQLAWYNEIVDRHYDYLAIDNYIKMSAADKIKFAPAIEVGLTLTGWQPLPYDERLLKEDAISRESKLIMVIHQIKKRYFNFHNIFDTPAEWVNFNKDDDNYKLAVKYYPKYLLLSMIIRKDLSNIEKNISELSWFIYNGSYVQLIINHFGIRDIEKILLLRPRKSSSGFKFLPDEIKDRMSNKFYKEYISKNPSVLRNVPPKKITRELALMAVKKSGSTIAFVPYDMRDQEICDVAFNNTNSALRHIPEKYQDQKAVMYKAIWGEDVMKYTKGRLRHGSTV